MGLLGHKPIPGEYGAACQCGVQGRTKRKGRFSRPFLSLPALLIASGADVKTVQARLWYASAKTTL